MFINISNHPTTKWGEKQVQAAHTMGQRQNETYDECLVDIPFPPVPPTASEWDIQDIAKNVLIKIGVFSADGTINRANHWDCPIFHVMGEMNLTYVLVRYLLQIGFVVVASTTERRVVENEDGTKTVQFEFVQFRKY